jgi:class 3 adenylate cyclase
MDAPDSEQERRFEEALKSVKAKNETSGKSKYWFLSEREGFDEHMEEEWFKAFHIQSVCKNLGQRFGVTCILILLISGLELQALIRWKIWQYPHALYSGRIRWCVYVYLRGTILFMNLLWWLAVDTFRWVKENPAQMQYLLAGSNMFCLVLMFGSYDALAFSDNATYREMVIVTHKGFRAPEDQSLILNFVLAYYLFLGLHKSRFMPLLPFLPLSFFLVGWARVYRALVDKDMKWEDNFSYQGGFLLFLQTMMNLSVAHDEEQASRASFKAEWAVKRTNERTEKILDTLMPPLVVEEIRTRPPNTPLPSHQYRHATIAQSDLCGFTQLSATKKPTEVVKFMGELFGLFDDLTDVHGVYKVETVGDAYIAGMAERPLTSENSPYHVILFGLDMVRAVDDWARNLGVKVACRCGITYGECMGGIVGNDMQRYHLFGDLLTVLEVMESTSEEGRVQISRACHQEVVRQLRDYTGEQAEKLTFVEREGESLKTSKGEAHGFEEVGGRSFLVESNKPLRHIGTDA